MSELFNTVTSLGNYNSIPTSLTSNTSVVNIIEGLTISKEADKKNWSDGNLTYTITIDNTTDTSYESVVVEDAIDTSLVELILESITINGAKAQTSEYSYENNTLKVNIERVGATSQAIITFSVKKKI